MTDTKRTPTRKPVYETGRFVAEKFGMTACQCCGRDFVANNNAVRMLELDQRTNTYHDDGDVPEDRSQGWFAFGLKCAKNELAKHRAALAKAQR